MPADVVENRSSRSLCKITLPLITLRDVANVVVPLDEQLEHMRLQEHHLDHRSERPERRLKLHRVFHQCGGVLLFEEMVVAETSEPTSRHAILKTSGTVICRDPAGVRNHEAEVTPAPSHFLAKPDQAGRNSCNGLFA